jgi:cardiolipin synthase A/B
MASYTSLLYKAVCHCRPQKRIQKRNVRFPLELDLSHLAILPVVFFAFEWFLRILMLLWIPQKRSPEAAKGWLLFLFFMPTIGIVAYWFIGRASMPHWRRERLKQLDERLAENFQRLRRNPNIVSPDLGLKLNQTVTLAENVGRLPPLAGNAAEIISDYQASIDRLAQDIDQAVHHVHLLYYIFAADESTEVVLDALVRARQRGVEVRILVDALGSKKMLPKLRHRLKGTNIEFHEILKTGKLHWRGTRNDLRNHRKIAVIDGRVGYTGSQNMIRPDFKKEIVYQELVVRVTGPIVVELQYVFVGDWYLESGIAIHDERYFPDPVRTGSVVAQALPSGPTFAPESTRRIVVALIHNSRKRVVLTTPYFIPDEPLQDALMIAALRGVEVHLVVSEIEDQFLVGQAQKSYYEDLLAGGVRIHLYQGHFLHAKHLTIDDQVSIIGSSNMDLRSFTLNAEISLIFYDQSVTQDLIAIEETYFARCRQLTMDEWSMRSYSQRLSQNICRLISPLL